MKRYTSIELLRFFTAITVLLYHYRHFFSPLNITSNQNYSFIKDYLPFNSIIEKLYEFGFYGVHVFYTISGFVFAYVYLSSMKNVSLKQYSINRFARLYPLHFVTLIYVIVFQSLFFQSNGNFQFDLINDAYHFFLQIFFISAWGFENGNSFNAPIWSVSVEIGIYILFFLLLSTIKKYNITVLVLLSLVLIAIDKSDTIQTLFLECARLFFSGVIVFYLYEKIIKKNFINLIISIFLLAVSFIGNFKIYIFCPAILMFFLSFEDFIKKEILTKYSNMLGNMTYSLYLLHVPTQLTLIFIFNKLNLANSIFNTTYFFIFYFLLLFIISYLVFVFFEKPLNKNIRKSFLKN